MPECTMGERDCLEAATIPLYISLKSGHESAFINTKRAEKKGEQVNETVKERKRKRKRERERERSIDGASYITLQP